MEEKTITNSKRKTETPEQSDARHYHTTNQAQQVPQELVLSSGMPSFRKPPLTEPTLLCEAAAGACRPLSQAPSHHTAITSLLDSLLPEPKSGDQRPPFIFNKTTELCTKQRRDVATIVDLRVNQAQV